MHVVPCESIDDCTYKSTEMDKLLALRAKVESLQRDVGGLEAIVLNRFKLLVSYEVDLQLMASNRYKSLT